MPHQVTEKFRSHLHRLHAGNRKPEAARNRVKRQYMARSRYGGRPFELSDSEFDALLGSPCFYCGEPWSNCIEEYDFRYNSIDRKDHALGYTVQNCVSCCRVCNDMKGTMGFAEFCAQIVKIFRQMGRI